MTKGKYLYINYTYAKRLRQYTINPVSFYLSEDIIVLFIKGISKSMFTWITLLKVPCGHFLFLVNSLIAYPCYLSKPFMQRTIYMYNLVMTTKFQQNHLGGHKAFVEVP